MNEIFKIKFSHNYLKFKKRKNGDMVQLLEVFPLYGLRDISLSFFSYDASYIDNDTDSTFFKETPKFFPFPKGNLLVLLFLNTLNDELFTTIRNRYGKIGDKYEYYKELRDKFFQVEINTV